MEDDSSGYATVLMSVNSRQLSKCISHFVTIFSGSEMMLFRVEVTSDKLEGCLKSDVLPHQPCGMVRASPSHELELTASSALTQLPS